MTRTSITDESISIRLLENTVRLYICSVIQEYAYTLSILNYVERNMQARICTFS